MLDYNPFTDTNIPKSNPSMVTYGISNRNYFPLLPSRVQKPGFLIAKEFQFSNVTDSQSYANSSRYEAPNKKRSYTENPFLKSHLLQDSQSYSKLYESEVVPESGVYQDEKLYRSNAKYAKQNGPYNSGNYYANLVQSQNVKLNSNKNFIKTSSTQQKEEKPIKDSNRFTKQNNNQKIIQFNNDLRNSQGFDKKKEDNQKIIKGSDGIMQNDQNLQAYSSKESAAFIDLQKPIYEDDPMNYNYPSMLPSLNMKGREAMRDSPQSPTWGNQQHHWKATNEQKYFRNAEDIGTETYGNTSKENIPEQIICNGRQFFLINTAPLDQL